MVLDGLRAGERASGPAKGELEEERERKEKIKGSQGAPPPNFRSDLGIP